MVVLWVAFEGLQRGAAYQPRVQPWVRSLINQVRSEGTPHITRSSIDAGPMRRSYRTPNSGNLFPQGCTLGGYAAPRWGSSTATQRIIFPKITRLPTALLRLKFRAR